MITEDVQVPAPAAADREPLLKVEGLTKHFPVRHGFRSTGLVRAVDGLDFEVRPGETLGLVGESGCGKTTTGRMLVRLLEPTAGRITFGGRDITHARREALRPLRQDLQIIFQDPYASLNPRHTVGRIVAMPLEVNGIKPPGGVKKRVQELLETVGLNPEHYNRYPHEFSGGQRQRIGIARALALRPKLIVADEPVSALDVSIQAQVINLLRDLQRELDLAFVFIAHDLAVVRHFCQRVAVMYLGKIVEVGDRAQIYERPQHPYTRALLSAIPDVSKLGPMGRIRLTGDVPTPLNPPSGCRFRTRCWKAQDVCATEEPALTHRDGQQLTACHFPEKGELR
jgi:peptide/nickel transport system ATP-binding protein